MGVTRITGSISALGQHSIKKRRHLRLCRDHSEPSRKRSAITKLSADIVTDLRPRSASIFATIDFASIRHPTLNNDGVGVLRLSAVASAKNVASFCDDCGRYCSGGSTVTTRCYGVSNVRHKVADQRGGIGTLSRRDLGRNAAQLARNAHWLAYVKIGKGRALPC